MKDKDSQHSSSMLPATAADLNTVKSRREDKQKQSALLTTIALCVHSLAEGVAMGSSLYRK
jgi:zinc transporter ZupT